MVANLLEFFIQDRQNAPGSQSVGMLSVPHCNCHDRAVAIFPLGARYRPFIVS